MKKSLFKDSFREIFKYPGRFLSIFTIVAIGTAFFAGIKASAPDMKYTADQYYDNYNMMDIRLLSTMGFVDEDVEAVKNIQGVKKVEASYFLDVVTTMQSSEIVFRIHSIPSGAGFALDPNFINMPKILEGRLPLREGECIIEVSKNLDLGLKIGDTLKVSSGKKEDLSATLKDDTYTIVGKAVSPYYLTFDKDASEIGSGKVNFWMMVVESEFLYPVHTEIKLTLEGAKELNSYSSAYAKTVEKLKNQLENLGADRAEIRLAEIKKTATAELEAARAKLLSEEATYNQEIGDAENKLTEARDKLKEGQATLDTEKKNYEIRVADAESQIREGEASLAKAENEYAVNLKKYNDAQEQYGESLEQLDSASTSLKGIQSDAANQKVSITAQLSDPSITPEQRTNLEEQLSSANSLYETANDGINTITGLNDYAKDSMESAGNQLAIARNTLNKARKDLNQAKSQLASEKQTANAQFAEAEATLAAGQIEYDAGKAELDQKKAEGAKLIQDGKEKIIRAENEIEKLSKPSWYVLDRTKLYSYADYAATADRMDAIAKLFPVFFFAVAALVCLTTMTRMVDEQRNAIGTYKALGYSNSSIAFKYVNYAALASVLGGVLGVIVGVKVFPKIIFDSWAMMYALPPMQEVVQIPLMVSTVIVGAFATTVTAYLACRNELKAVPAMLMRPKAPKAGKMILIERITGVWERFSFSQKVTMRNIFRYKKRFFMTVIGIAGCAALLVAGFGLNNSIGKVVEKQYQEIFTFDLNMRYSPSSEEKDKEAVMTLLNGNKEVSSILKISQMNATIEGPDGTIAATMISPLESDKLQEYIKLRDRISQRAISLPLTGIVINEKLAKELNVSVGDSIAVDNGDGAVKKLEINAITENYVFHYIYINPDYYKEIFRLSPENNAVMIKLKVATPENETKLGSTLISKSSVASVIYYSDAALKFKDTVKSLNAIVYAIIVCAGLLAFVVLYNLTNINLSERLREIATIKVLGFYNSEVASYVYRENIILTIIGSGAGLLIGISLHMAIMTSLEQNGIMFGNYIAKTSFLYAFLITFFFGILVNVFMYRKLTNIKMVESLKSIE